jgi:thioester reductase-like protein
VSDVDERVVRLLQDARRQLELERELRTSPIAVVGIGCRFPGGASSPERFWELLREGRDATSDTPDNRWDVEAFYDPDPEATGKYYVRRGAYLADIEGFDPEFFGISPREALAMDPQQRLLLEVAWEALEDARIPTDRLRGTATGVWVGMCLDDYARRSVTSGDPERISAHAALGNTRSIAPGRLAYLLDLHGPAIQVDTSCTSSLIAVHQACQSLRLGECDTAISGGVSLMSAPEASVALCKLRSLSRDGRCRSFDASADGYGRGEGCGVVVLRRLRDALASGDRVHAIIRGSTANHNGRSNGLTAPSRAAQEAAIRTALSNAGVAPADISYVEAHGTGTLLGDCIEMIALGNAYGENRPAGDPLRVGTVKTNIGHLEAASGIAALIKVVLSLARAQLPANLYFDEPNPSIPWERLPVQVSGQTSDWRSNGRPLTAGVNSFGINGTNAHLIVEQAAPQPQAERAAARASELIVLSARSRDSLQGTARKLLAQLAEKPELRIGEVAYSLATTRVLLEQRLAFSVSSRQELLDILGRIVSDEWPAKVGQAPRAKGGLGWLFPADESNECGADELRVHWPVFRLALEEATSALEQHSREGLQRGLVGPLGEPGVSTKLGAPALFAFQWALAALWQSFGVQPDVVTGHGVGEVAAALVAGVFSLSDAARLVIEWTDMASSSGTMGVLDAGARRQIERVAQSITYLKPVKTIASSTDGAPVGPEVSTASYWVTRLESWMSSPKLRATSKTPTVLLLGSGREIQHAPDGGAQSAAISSLELGVPAPRAILTALGAWLVGGGAVSWDGVFPLSEQRRRVDLPTYAWDRRPYWLPAVAARQAASAAVPRLALGSTAPGAARAHLDLDAALQLIQGEVARVLALSPAHAVAPDRPLADFGLDSLLAVELRAGLGHRLGLELPPTIGIDSALTTVGTLAERLVTALGEGDRGNRASPSYQVDAVREATRLPAFEVVPPSEPTSALLTGATGFLGAFILSELLLQTTAQVTCLVRAESERAGLARIEKNLASYGLLTGNIAERVRALPGDLSEAQLGLSRGDFEALAGSVDAIYSNAAHVSYVAAYEEMRPSHVLATRDLISLAGSGRPKIFHHISSVAAFESAVYRDVELPETALPEQGGDIHLAYAQCKWVTEALVRAASGRGMPATIFRPAFIGGSSLTGAWSIGDFLCRFLLGIVKVESIPDLDTELDFAPVDFVSRAIVHLSRQPGALKGAFNLRNPRGLHLRELAEILSSHGYPVKLVPYGRWLESIARDRAGPLYALLAFLSQRLQPENLTYVELSQKRYRSRVSCDEATRVLGLAGINCPALDRDLVGRYLRYLVAAEALPPP